MARMIQIVDPTVKRGTPPRLLRMSDMIWVPVNYRQIPSAYPLESTARFTLSQAEEKRVKRAIS